MARRRKTASVTRSVAACCRIRRVRFASCRDTARARAADGWLPGGGAYILLPPLAQRGWSMRLLKAFLADVSGATAIEYGLIAALISVAIVASFTALGN